MKKQTVLVGYSAALLEANNRISDGDIIAVANRITKTKITNSFIYICGNGGSASTASHFAVDLGVGTSRQGFNLRVLSIADNSGVITATGNDLDYSSVFASQIKHLGRQGDLLILISASGNSGNLLKAVEVAQQMGLDTISFTGFDGGVLKKVTDLNVHVETALGSYGVVEDLHLSICHRVTELIRMDPK